MTLKQEFEKLVKEANKKTHLQNLKREAEEANALKNLRKQKELLLNLLAKTSSGNELSQGFTD